jgi:hypothetical protein
MKEISIRIEDELYRRASQKAEDIESEVDQYVTKRLEAISDDDGILAARVHMSELFAATRNFGVGIKPSREEMHQGEGMIHLAR